MALQPESIYKIWQISSTFQHQNGCNRPRRARRVSNSIPLMTDSRKWPTNPKIFTSPKPGRQHYNSSDKSRVYDHAELEKVSASDFFCICHWNGWLPLQQYRATAQPVINSSKYHGSYGRNKRLYKHCAFAKGNFDPPQLPRFSADLSETEDQV